MEPRNNKREPGCAGSKGVEFQVSLLTVFLLNALQRLNNWKLSTESKRAGKFDDVVLECSTGDTLLQAKTKEDKSKAITLRDLLSTHPNSNFGLLKYFVSYQEVRDKFKIKNVIVCANIGFDSKVLSYLKKQYACSDSMLYYGRNDCAFYTFTDDILSLLMENVPSYLENLKDKDKAIDRDMITEERLKDFFKHLQFYSNYPSGHRLRNVIEQILTHMNLRCRISSSEIYAKVMDWFQNKKSVHNEASAKAILSEIFTDKHWEMLEKYNIHFEHNDFNFLQPKRIFHVTAEGGHLLQEIKIYRALKDNKVRSLYANSADDLEVQKEAIEAFGLPDYTFLVIVCLSLKNESVTREMYDRLKGTLGKYHYKKVILLTVDDNKLLKEIFYENSDHHIFDGRVTFTGLTSETQEGILKKESIEFQGEYISLETLLSKLTDDYKKTLSHEILEMLIRNQKIIVGQALENVSSFYINRTLLRKKEWQDERGVTLTKQETISEENIFQVNDKVILVIDSAGMGKSTLLIKLAGVIKQQNPHLWVVRIELNHCTAYLGELLRNKEAVNVMELLQFSSGTKLPNPLEKFVFSLERKVVLMFDGVDEISPDFTDLVVTSIVQCRNMPKVVVTARPHMTKLLETKLQVKSVMLQPFTEQNQIDFLADHWTVNLVLDEEDKEKCKEYAKLLITTIDRDAIFTAIPLQVKMMAEIFQETNKLTESTVWVGCKEYLIAVDTEPKLQNLNVKKLYELFIEKKGDVFVQKSNPSGNVAANQALIDQFNESLIYHRALALDMVLKNIHVETFKSYRERNEDTETTMLKIGIVQKVDDGLHFLHRTFAEYFVADSIVRELRLQNTDVKFQRIFVDEILVDSEFNVVRAFLNNFLQQVVTLPSDSLREYKSHKYEDHWLEWRNFHIIHILADEGHTAILNFLLKCIGFKIVRNREIDIAELYKADTDKGIPMGIFDNTLTTLKVLLTRGGLNIKNNEDKTPFYLAVKAGHIEMVKFLWEHGANINSEQPVYTAASKGNLEMAKFLIEQGAIAEDWEVLRVAILCNQTHIVSYVFEKVLKSKKEKKNKPIIAYMAAFLGQMNILKDLIEGGLDVNCKIKLKLYLSKNNDNEYLIFGAARGKQPDIIRYLLQSGAHINIKGGYDSTILHLNVAESMDISTVKLLVDGGININNRDEFGSTALKILVKMGNFELVKFLVENGANINTRDDFGKTAVSEAASKGELDILEYLVLNEGDVNIIDDEGNTAVHCAITSGDVDTVRFLTTLGMDKDVTNNKGQTALHIAAKNGKPDMVEWLVVEFGMDIHARDNDGRTALYLAATESADTVELLVRLGVDVNIADNRGCTPLHLACRVGEWICMDTLLGNNADVNVRDKFGHTPLFMIVQRASDSTQDFLDKIDYPSLFNNLNILNLLVYEYGADINLGDNSGRTPLHEAVEGDHLYIVHVLAVSLKADVNVRDKEGRTPLHLAANKGLSIVKILIQQGANINIKDYKGKTAADLTGKKGHLHLLSSPKRKRIFSCLKYCDPGTYSGSYSLKET